MFESGIRGQRSGRRVDKRSAIHHPGRDLSRPVCSHAEARRAENAGARASRPQFTSREAAKARRRGEKCSPLPRAGEGWGRGRRGGNLPPVTHVPDCAAARLVQATRWIAPLCGLSILRALSFCATRSGVAKSKKQGAINRAPTPLPWPFPVSGGSGLRFRVFSWLTVFPRVPCASA